MTAAYVEAATAKRRVEERYIEERTRYNRENVMLTHAAQNNHR